MLLAPSISGLFKWRQFEPEVILLAVGWYLRFFLVVPGRGGVARRAGTACRSRHSVEVGAALRSGNGTTFAQTAQGNQRLVAGGL
jgi:hypothetical protein